MKNCQSNDVYLDKSHQKYLRIKVISSMWKQVSRDTFSLHHLDSLYKYLVMAHDTYVGKISTKYNQGLHIYGKASNPQVQKY